MPYQPRPLQRVLHAALEAHRFSVAVCHRRFGKTVCAINHLQKQALTCKKDAPRFAYIAPTYKQGKDVAWAYMKHYAAPIPGHSINESELRIDYPNGGRVRIYGADNPDSLRGIYLDGVVLDEYGLMPNELWGEVIRPLLSDRQGWAFFIGTPNGRNEFYTKVQDAKRLPDWFFAEYKASTTHILPDSELEDARRTMTEDEYQQEYECSFDASVKGAVYLRELQQARQDGRITHVPYDAARPVDTYWDLGIRDKMAIWFGQRMFGGAIHIIDYYENQGFGLDHYANVLRSKPYHYQDDVFPHDLNQRELTTGKSRVEYARSLGLKVWVQPQLSIDDGIHAARMVFPKCWFDAEKCAVGLEALASYKYRWNVALKYWMGEPAHDGASHGADAFRTLAVAVQAPRQRLEREKPDVDPDDWRYGKNLHLRSRGNPYMPVRP